MKQRVLAIGWGAKLQAEVCEDIGTIGGVGSQGVNNSDWLYSWQGYSTSNGLPECLPGLPQWPAGSTEHQVFKQCSHGLSATHCS